SRLESGAYNPSLDMLIKVAKSLGKEVHIQLR
ncbi:MAG: helix-turn-helix domain-containing protein, partial [Sedimentibacter sp.]